MPVIHYNKMKHKGTYVFPEPAIIQAICLVDEQDLALARLQYSTSLCLTLSYGIALEVTRLLDDDFAVGQEAQRFQNAAINLCNGGLSRLRANPESYNN